MLRRGKQASGVGVIKCRRCIAAVSARACPGQAFLFACPPLWRAPKTELLQGYRYCMAKEELLEMRGKVVELLPNAMFLSLIHI